MILALLLIALQIIHNHEFIYRRYWPVFWRYSAYYALIIYIGSLINFTMVTVDIKILSELEN